jgi:hypothetical protein
MDFSSILNHPKRNEIVSKILSGVSAKDISNWLKLQFQQENESHLRFNSELALAQSGDEKAISSLKNNKTWKERVDKLLDDKIDIKDRLNKMEKLVYDRMEQIFDGIQENPGTVKLDHVLVKYFDHYLKLLDTYNKSINLAPDMIIQHNHTVDYIDRRANALQDAVYETLAEMDQEFSNKFLDKLNLKLASLKYNEETIEIKESEIKKLESRVISYEEP